MKRSGSSNRQFVQRIPADVRPRAIGLTLDIPRGDGFARVTITDRTEAVRFSLRTSDPAEAKRGHCAAAAHLVNVWEALRRTEPVTLSRKQATALAGDLYRTWADEERGRTTAIVLDRETRASEPAYPDPEEDAQGFANAARKLAERIDAGEDLGADIGPLVTRVLVANGIAEVTPESQHELLHAFAQALRDAFEHRERNAQGDYSPDPKATRFPEWKAPSTPDAGPTALCKVTLTGLFEDWWRDAERRGLSASTHDSYRRTIKLLTAFLGHNAAARVTPDDVRCFRDHRVTSVSPRTVRENDLAGLKSVFGWAVEEGKLPSNPAAEIKLRAGKRPKLRSKGFTDHEARAILQAALAYRKAPQEEAQTAAAKRWAHWLMAYTGARVGEIAQLRKQDVFEIEGIGWCIGITPDAGAVKTKEARTVPLHLHLVEQGFVTFAQAAPPGPLFRTPGIKPGKDGRIRGGVISRLAEFARQFVPDPHVSPDHGWRHRFKTVGMEAGIAPRVLDAIQGHAPRTEGEGYGDVTPRTMAAAIAKLPRIEVADTQP